jgi:cytochrome c556
MKRIILVAGLLTVGAVTALAQQTSVIEQRQALMKNNAEQTRTLSGMLRGQVPYNADQAKAALTTLSQNAKKIPPLFPENSKTGGDTKALPAIWENKADFDSIAAQLDKGAQTALASITDEASFKAAAPKALEACGTCHKTYRKS